MNRRLKSGPFSLDGEGLPSFSSDNPRFSISDFLDFLGVMEDEVKRKSPSRVSEAVQRRVPADDKAVLPWLLR